MRPDAVVFARSRGISAVPNQLNRRRLAVSAEQSGRGVWYGATRAPTEAMGPPEFGVAARVPRAAGNRSCLSLWRNRRSRRSGAVAAGRAVAEGIVLSVVEDVTRLYPDCCGAGRDNGNEALRFADAMDDDWLSERGVGRRPPPVWEIAHTAYTAGWHCLQQVHTAGCVWCNARCADPEVPACSWPGLRQKANRAHLEEHT